MQTKKKKMALIHNRELRSINTQDLENKLVELEKELMKYNAQIAIGTIPKSPGLVKETKKTIAKIKTILREREKNIQKEQRVEEKKKHD